MIKNIGDVEKMKKVDRDFIRQLSRWHTESRRDNNARPGKDEALIDNGWEIIFSISFGFSSSIPE